MGKLNEKNILIVLPTYDASKTILGTIRKIISSVPYAFIVIVDDSSPDGTQKIIRENFSNDKRVNLISRSGKQGRGSAVLHGFKQGLKNKKIEFFIEMDADLCHDPKYIPLMVKKIRDYDVVIASKYLSGSKIIGLSLKRKLFSLIVNRFLRLTLQVPITDYTNGFRCYKRSVLEALSFSKFHAKGFFVLSEIAYKIYKNGGTFGEIPFEFIFHNLNRSNFSKSEIKEALLTVIKLKLEELNYLKFRKWKNKMPT